MWHWRPPRDPPPFMANAIWNFHFDYLHTSLISSYQIEDWQDGQSCPETSGEMISSKSQADSLTQTCPGQVSRPRVSRPCPSLPTVQRSWKGFCYCAVIAHTICHSPFFPWTWWLREWQSTRWGRERQRWRSTKSREWGGRFSQTWGTLLWPRHGSKISIGQR